MSFMGLEPDFGFCKMIFFLFWVTEKPLFLKIPKLFSTFPLRNDYRAVIFTHPKPGEEWLSKGSVECVQVTECPSRDTVEGQGTTGTVQIHPDPVGARLGCWDVNRLVVVLSAIVILRAEQTPRLVCVAKTTDVRTSPTADPPHCHGDIHPASTPLHLPVVPMGEALVTEHLGDRLKPVWVIWVLLFLPDPCDLLTPIVQKKRLGRCVGVKRQHTFILF